MITAMTIAILLVLLIASFVALGRYARHDAYAAARPARTLFGQAGADAHDHRVVR